MDSRGLVVAVNYNFALRMDFKQGRQICFGSKKKKTAFWKCQDQELLQLGHTMLVIQSNRGQNNDKWHLKHLKVPRYDLKVADTEAKSPANNANISNCISTLAGLWGWRQTCIITTS